MRLGERDGARFPRSLRKVGFAPFLVVVLSASLAHAWSIPPAELPTTVHQLRGLVEQALFADGDPSALPLLVPDRTLHSGRVTTDVTWLYDAVRSPERQRLVEAWDRLRGWSDALGTPPTVDPRQLHALTAEILSDEAYQPVRVASWIDPWLPSIERLFDFLFAPFLNRAEDNSPWRKAAVGGLYTLLLLTGVGWLLKATRRRGQPTTEPSGLPVATLRSDPQAAADRLAESRNEAAAGRHEAALGRLYLAVLQRLDEQGRLTFHPSRTNHENTQAARHDPEAAAVLGELGPVVDSVIYGKRRCSADQWQVHLDRAQRLWSES